MHRRLEQKKKERKKEREEKRRRRRGKDKGEEKDERAYAETIIARSAQAGAARSQGVLTCVAKSVVVEGRFVAAAERGANVEVGGSSRSSRPSSMAKSRRSVSSPSCSCMANA